MDHADSTHERKEEQRHDADAGDVIEVVGDAVDGHDGVTSCDLFACDLPDCDIPDCDVPVCDAGCF
jgi:hypothetical protein